MTDAKQQPTVNLGHAAHVQWEQDRGTENECDAENAWLPRQKQPGRT
jgi:hypothetical protein